MEVLIKELNELQIILKNDGYKDWCYAQLTIDKTIKSLKNLYTPCFCKSDFVKQMNELNDWQTEITIDALNHYLNYIIDKLSRNNLGYIERKNLELDKGRTYSTLMCFEALNMNANCKKEVQNV